MQQKVLSISEFKKFCDLKPMSFIFDTNSQYDGGYSAIKQKFKFDKVIIMSAPDCICFKNDCGIMRLNNVEVILYIEDFIKKYFCIICKDVKSEDTKSRYIIDLN